MRLNATRIGVLAALGVVALVACAAVAGPRGATQFAGRSDPTGAYRVEFLTATNAQRWFNPWMDIPGTARLVRVKDGAVLARSGIVDFFGGGNAEIFWPSGADRTVQVGRDITLTVPDAASR